ncbi:hypothetical protein BC829DRAFT_402458 [Chytridium lagenaria]|nr:hypothetical protein BC829DRAFT_402458 [Chytridium lagenaria]
MFPPVPIRDVGMNEYPPLPGMSNVLEIKISQTNLLVLQAHTEKDKQDLLSIHALIQTNEWDQTPDAVHSLLSHPAPSTTTLVEETPPAVCELFKELCRPFLKTTEWEKLPKAFMYVVAELDGTRPRIVFSNETTYRELGHLGISVSTTMIESDPKSVILSAYPVNSKAMAQYLIRFKDSTICNRFKDEVNKAAANVTQFIYKSRQSSLLIESPSSLPTLLDLTCPTLTFTSIDVTSFSPQKASDLGAARVVVKGEDEKVVVEITSTVNKDVTWLCSNVLDETFKVEEGGDKTLGRSSDSIMTMDSLTVARPVGYSITLVFATSSEKRYKLTFPAATPSVKSLLKLLDRPFTSPSINTPPVITHTSSSTPRLATSPGRTATGLLAARHVKSTGDLASSAVSTSRGVTGWVAERVAYFNELARRSAGVGRGVLERWVAAMEAVKEEERGKEKGRVEKGGIEMCRSEKIGKDDGYKKNVEEDVNQSGMKSGNSVVVEVGDVECVREFEHSKNVVVEALTMKMKQVDNMVEEVDMQCLKEIEQVDMSCLKEIKQAEDVVEESVLHSDKDGVEISVATEEEIYQEDFDSTLKSDIKLVHVDQDTPDSDDLNNTTMISQLDLPIDYITNVTEDDSAPTSTTENPPEKLSTPSLLSPQPLLPSLHPDVPVAAELTLPKDPTALISTLLALYPPFTGTTATPHHTTSQRKLLPHDDFPAQVKQVWESMPYTVQYILVKIGLESKDAGMVARAWLNIDRTNLEKVNPDYVVSRPAHIQGPSM